MKVLFSSILMAAIILSASPTLAGIRCGNDIISIGDTSFEVMAKISRCGEVLSKETVGKETSIENGSTTGDKIKKVRVVELWYVRVKEGSNSYCYPLTFEEGRLKNIGSWKRCD